MRQEYREQGKSDPTEARGRQGQTTYASGDLYFILTIIKQLKEFKQKKRSFCHEMKRRELKLEDMVVGTSS